VASDPCEVCGEKSEVGCVGVSKGEVYHHSYCNKCYNRIKLGNQTHKPKREASPTEIRLKKLGFRIKALNKGQQLVLKRRAQIVDFWPSSEKFVIRSTGETGTGVFNLAGMINV